MIGKIHLFSGKKIFASCDKSLIDKKIEADDFEVYFSKNFYGEKELTIDQIIKYIEQADSSNIFGEKVCSLLLERKIILKESIIYINNIPHVQIYKF